MEVAFATLGILGAFHLIGSEASERHRFQFSGPSQLGFVAGTANGNVMDAFADTGAGLNIISSATVRRLGLTPEPTAEDRVTLANGAKARLEGSVWIDWVFADDSTHRLVQCFVLKNCPHPLVLGSKFLRLTETLTKFKHRIKKALSKRFGSRRIAVNFFHPDQAEGCYMEGFLNGQSTKAVPDSGSECCLMSADYARKHGIVVDKSPSQRYILQFIDSSEAITSGLAANVRWSFSRHGRPLFCDFLVLEGLPVDLLLSNDFIDRFDVFSEYKHLMSTDMLVFEDESPGAFGVILLGKFSEELSNLEQEYYTDITSPNPFSPQMVTKEVARRNAIQMRITHLPEQQQTEASVEEQKRTQAWEAYRQNWEAHKSRALARIDEESLVASASQSTAGETSSRSHLQRKTRLVGWLLNRRRKP